MNISVGTMLHNLTGSWRFIKPIYEVENGTYKINVCPEKEVFVKEYIQAQGRFGQMTEDMVNTIQQLADRKWAELIRMADETG